MSEPTKLLGKKNMEDKEKKENPFQIINDDWMNDEEIGCETNCTRNRDCTPDCDGAWF
jgi:hypothetical protein